MVSSCCYFGIPLQRATQYVAIADIILGVLNFSLVAVQLAHFQQVQVKIESSYDHENEYYRASFSHHYQSSPTSRPRRTFIPLFDRLPYGLIITVVICYAIQLVMGVVLYVAAANKHRGTLILWMIMTAFTALFTGLILRLYEMVIVNEFCRELKNEQEVTYFHDPHLHGHARPVPQPQPVYPNYGNINQPDALVPPVEPCASITMISGNGPGLGGGGGITGYSTYPGFGPTANSNQYGFPGGYSGNYTGFSNNSAQQPLQFQYETQNIPAALQPPPQYDEAVKQGPYYFNVNSASGGGENAGSSGFSNPRLPGPSTQAGRANAPPASHLFPEKEKGNDFSTSFSKF